MRDLSTYINSRTPLNESIQRKDFETARAIIVEYMKKHGIYSLPFVDNIEMRGQNYYGNLVFSVKQNNAAFVLWGDDRQMNDSTSIKGILFFSDATKAVAAATSGDMKGIQLTADATLKTNMVSMAKLLPLLKDVLTGTVAMNQKDLQSSLSSYGVFESEEPNGETSVNESEETDEIIQQLSKKKGAAYLKWYNKKKSGAPQDEIDAAKQEFEELKRQYEDVKARVGGPTRITVTDTATQEVNPVQAEFQKRLDPQTRYRHMENYIMMVAKGQTNGLVICGAPGVGKTYRVKKTIKSLGYDLGKNYQLITGRCTTAALFTALYNYSREDDITVIDDCDEVMFDNNSVNLIKAATELNDERILSYFVSRGPEISEEDAVMRHPDLAPDAKGKYHVPNQFQFNGRIIIITNLYPESIDTAIKSRCKLANMDFTVEETLDIVKDLMPKIMPNKLTMGSKDLAFSLLQEMVEKKADVEISIRSFASLAAIYECCGDTEDAREMCLEQIRLQFAKGSRRKRY